MVDCAKFLCYAIDFKEKAGAFIDVKLLNFRIGKIKSKSIAVFTKVISDEALLKVIEGGRV